jgi:hypothetical protein
MPYVNWFARPRSLKVELAAHANGLMFEHAVIKPGEPAVAQTGLTHVSGEPVSTATVMACGGVPICRSIV